MSRIGKMPIPLPAGVSAQVGEGAVRVTGPLGVLDQALPELVGVTVDGDHLTVTRKDDSRQARANHGLTRALLANMVAGVAKGWQKKLEVVGVGYRAEVKAGNLVLNIGYSHPVQYVIPGDVRIEVDKANKITVNGSDRQRVGQVAANIREFRTPDHYKGKGIRYEGEAVRIKAGKSA